MWLLASGLFVCGGLLNYAISAIYPIQYQQCLIFCAIHSISVASRFQMIATKVKRALLPLFGVAPKYIEFISNDNTVVYRTSVDKLDHEIKDTSDYDVFIYSEPNDKTVSKKFMLCNHELPVTLEPSNIRFIMIELNANNKSIRLDFTVNNNNYYVVGNIINSRFLNYFVNRYYEVKSLENYTLNIIDNNVNMIEVREGDSIRLDKNTYTIIRDKSKNGVTK
jgi:hypothetical protein